MAAELAAELETRDVADSAPRWSRSPRLRLWSGLWPQLVAFALALVAWQVVVWSGWRPANVLPGPLPVFRSLVGDLSNGDFYIGVAITLQRAVLGYGIAVVTGSAVGLLVPPPPILPRALAPPPPGPPSFP